MDAFAILGFIFGMSAFATATKLKKQLDELQKDVDALKSQSLLASPESDPESD